MLSLINILNLVATIQIWIYLNVIENETYWFVLKEIPQNLKGIKLL